MDGINNPSEPYLVGMTDRGTNDDPCTSELSAPSAVLHARPDTQQDGPGTVEVSDANSAFLLLPYEQMMIENGVAEKDLCSGLRGIVELPELVETKDVLLTCGEVPDGPLRDAAASAQSVLLTCPDGKGGLDHPFVALVDGAFTAPLVIEGKGKRSPATASALSTLGAPRTPTAKVRFGHLEQEGAYTAGAHVWDDEGPCCPARGVQHRRADNGLYEACQPQLFGLGRVGGTANAVHLDVTGEHLLSAVVVEHVPDTVRGLLVSWTAGTRAQLAVKYGVHPNAITDWSAVTWLQLLELFAERLAGRVLSEQAQAALQVFATRIWFLASWRDACKISPAAQAWISPRVLAVVGPCPHRRCAQNVAALAA